VAAWEEAASVQPLSEQAVSVQPLSELAVSVQPLSEAVDFPAEVSRAVVSTAAAFTTGSTTVADLQWAHWRSE
jgi:hypothetical protein